MIGTSNSTGSSGTNCRFFPSNAWDLQSRDPAVSYRRTSWVWEITGWSSRLQKITDHCKVIYRIHPNLREKNWQMWTCNRLDMQTLAQPVVMPEKLPEQFLGPHVKRPLCKCPKRRCDHLIGHPPITGALTHSLTLSVREMAFIGRRKGRSRAIYHPITCMQAIRTRAQLMNRSRYITWHYIKLRFQFHKGLDAGVNGGSWA